VTFTGTVTATNLRTDFDANTAQLLTNSTTGRKDWTIFHRMETLATGDALSIRTRAFTLFDDAEVRDIFVRVTDTAAAATVTGTLTQDEGDTEFLLDVTVSIDVVAINGTIDSRTAGEDDYRTTTGSRFTLKRGVRYRLTLSTAAADVGVTMIVLQLRSRRREA
jgi:hypothetical protein